MRWIENDPTIGINDLIFDSFRTLSERRRRVRDDECAMTDET